MKKILLISALAIFSLYLSGQVPVLVKQIGTTLGGSDPDFITLFKKTTLIFVANDGISGRELWFSDGSEIGTYMIKDINPGAAFSYPSHIISLDENTSCFWANDGTHGIELWRTDGSDSGTYMIKDINPGTANGQVFSSYSFVMYKGNLYFAGKDTFTGIELWKSNGTDSGTKVVKDINPGPAASTPILLGIVNDLLFFRADNPTYGSELWATDGSDSGTYMVKDIEPGAPGSFIGAAVSTKKNIYFNANTSVYGQELWTSDGTDSGTYILKDIRSGTLNSSPTEFALYNDSIFYFSANDGINGTELWKSNGTDSGTMMISDISTGASSTPKKLVLMNEIMYFEASNGGTLNGRELWRSDGTDSGTYMVKDINPGTGSSVPTYMTNIADTILFFKATDGSSGIELWQSNGTENGTNLVYDMNIGTLNSSPNNFIQIGKILYFSAQNDEIGGRELWKLDMDFLCTSLTTKIIIDTSFELASATANVSGGHPPYTYNWSTGGSSPMIDSLLEGTYQLIVQDSFQCIDTLSFDILYNKDSIPSAFTVDIKNVVMSFYPNPFNERLAIENKTIVNDLQINIYDISGQIVRQENIHSKPIIYIEREELPSGIYSIIVLSNNQIVVNQKLLIY